MTDAKRLPVMSLGQAIEWMMRNPEKQMVDAEFDRWEYDGEQDFVLTTNSERVTANILVPVMLQHEFRIAKDHRGTPKEPGHEG